MLLGNSIDCSSAIVFFGTGEHYTFTNSMWFEGEIFTEQALDDALRRRYFRLGIEPRTLPQTSLNVRVYLDNTTFDSLNISKFVPGVKVGNDRRRPCLRKDLHLERWWLESNTPK